MLRNNTSDNLEIDKCRVFTNIKFWSHSSWKGSYVATSKGITLSPEMTQAKQKYWISNHPKCSIYYEYPARIYSYDKIDVYIWLKKNHSIYSSRLTMLVVLKECTVWNSPICLLYILMKVSYLKYFPLYQPKTNKNKNMKTIYSKMRFCRIYMYKHSFFYFSNFRFR